MRAVRAPSRAEFGQGMGTIWMDEVEWRGTKQDLTQCNFNGWRNHNCSHYEDTEAVCEGVCVGCL